MTDKEKKDLKDFEKDIIQCCAENWNDLQTNQELLDKYKEKRKNGDKDTIFAFRMGEILATRFWGDKYRREICEKYCK